MPSLTITPRKTRTGTRYAVRYRLGGRAYPLVHAGSFKTLREAKVRRDVVAGELAAGRNPQLLLQAMTAAPVVQTVTTVSVWSEKYMASRIDADTNTLKNYRSGLKKVCARFGDRDPVSLTADDVAGWVSDLAGTLKPGTVQLYLLVFRMLLDYIGVDPNPCRDPRVRLPKRVREEPNPPTTEHYLAILDAVGDRWRLPLITIEQGALREGELVHLTWGDVDAVGLRLRLPRSSNKTDKARWVQLPEWLMDAIENTCPLEDRVAERRVFQGMTTATLYQAMTRACKLARTPHYDVKSLRHRRITRWHQSGVVAREVADRAGHSDPWMSLNVYTHVMPLDEAPEERLMALIGA